MRVLAFWACADSGPGMHVIGCWEVNRVMLFDAVVFALRPTIDVAQFFFGRFSHLETQPIRRSSLDGPITRSATSGRPSRRAMSTCGGPIFFLFKFFPPNTTVPYRHLANWRSNSGHQIAGTPRTATNACRVYGQVRAGTGSRLRRRARQRTPAADMQPAYTHMPLRRSAAARDPRLRSPPTRSSSVGRGRWERAV